MLRLTSSDIGSLQARADRLASRAKAAIAKGQEILEQFVYAAEVGASAFVFGVLDGRYDGIELIGMPATLLAAGALHVLAFVAGPKYGTHLHAAGNGALGAYTYTLGRSIGVGWKLESTGATKQLGPGAKTTGPGASITDEELARVAMGQRAA